jgi:rare lipoprotein A
MNCVIDPLPVVIWPWCRLLRSAIVTCRISVGWRYNLSSISCARIAYVDIKANRIHLDAPLVSAAGVRNVIRLFAVALVAALLAACAQSSVVTRKSELVSASRQASLEPNRQTSFVTNRRVAVTRKHTPFASHKDAAETEVASHGVASFYTEGTQTANGEKFDTNELTAAHRTLPFGTRLRVTSVATGRSVTVRVNDRGPFVPGRVVDVSYSAARTLGMVDGGVAKVNLDVVQ